MSTGTPTASRIADRLDVDPDQLRRFVEFHPDPDATDVVGLADRVTLDELGAETRAGIGRWIDDVRDRPDTDDLPGATIRFDGLECGFQSSVWFDHTNGDRDDVETPAE